jgi:malto-oligosyltrehalose trehalohydrolase
MSRHHAYPLPFGAELIGPRKTRFRLWAPGTDTVAVELDGIEPIPMQAVGEGWFESEVNCGAGARYKYRVSKDLAVPDPASRLQSGDVHDPSVVVDPRRYAWKHRKWLGRPWRETVLYELHVGALGGYRGVTKELPRLAELGITAVELMPVNDFPGTRNWGYDGVLPYAPDASYGSPEDLKELIDTAHGLDLMVFLDVVYNHFGPDGNYLPSYAPQFFHKDSASPWGQSIDFSQPAVRDYFTRNALYWIHEYRFDGLRFDATDHIGDPEWLPEMAAAVRASVEPGRYVHLVIENGDNLASHLERGIDAQWNDDGHHALHVLLTGESDGYYADYAIAPAAALATCLSEGFIFQGQKSAFRGGKRRGTPSKHLPPTAFVLFLQNHDQIGNRAYSERLSWLAAPQALAAAQTLLLLCPHIPLLFMGEEWASRTPFFFFTDHNSELAKAVRDGRRREFASFGAFADEDMAQKIPDPNAKKTFERSIPDHGDLHEEPYAEALKLTKRLLRLRAEKIAPHLDGAKSTGTRVLGASAVVARWKLGDGSRLSIHANLGASSVQCTREARGELLMESRRAASMSLARGVLSGFTTVVRLEQPKK